MKFQTRDILPLAAIVGVIALAAMGLHFWIGLGLFVVDIGLLILFARRKHNNAPRQIPPMRTVVSEFELTESPVPSMPKPATPKPVGNEFYQPLLSALRSGGYVLNAPVVYTDTMPITAEDIIISIAHIMQEKGDNIQAMTMVIPTMYSLIWEHTEEAIKRYSDIELIKLHIASSVYFKAKVEVKP